MNFCCDELKKQRKNEYEKNERKNYHTFDLCRANIEYLDAEKSRIVIHVFTKTVRRSSLTVYPFTADCSYIYEGKVYSAKQLEESGSAVGIIFILRRKSCWRKEL